MPPASAAPKPSQPELPGLAEAFAAVGVDNLPVGITSLTPKQRRFCLEYLRTGLSGEAARLAGYSDPETQAPKVRKNSGVAAFLAHAAKALTEETKQLVMRAEERSRALQTLLVAEMNKAEGKQSLERIAKLSSAVNRTDTLLAALKSIGRVSTVNLSGDVQHSHAGEVALTLPATALPVLAEMRQDAVKARTGGPN